MLNSLLVANCLLPAILSLWLWNHAPAPPVGVIESCCREWTESHDSCIETKAGKISERYVQSLTEIRIWITDCRRTNGNNLHPMLPYTTTCK